MALWDHGYVTDVAYTTNAYMETTPAWLAACSIMLQYQPPDLTAPFRYADLGCGNGLNAMIAAATNPNAEVWGFDFNPTHIENARAMVALAGLTNIRFEEMSFESLAQGGADIVSGPFDLMVAHGVLSWISLENRRHLAGVFGRWLRPGGLAYISYNATSGWSGVEPIRLLMRQLAVMGQRRTDQEVPDIFKTLDQLKTGGSLFFQAHPGLEARLEQMKRLDPRYIAHEFLNRDWHPVMFADVAEAMAEARTIFIGTATLLENIDALSVPATIVPILNTVRDIGIRETMRDLASAKSFRRDLWRRGGEPMPIIEQSAKLDALTLVWTGKVAEDPIRFTTPFGNMTGQPEFYGPMMAAILAGPASIGQFRAMPQFQNRPLGDFVQAAMLLIGGGYAFPASPTGNERGAREASLRLNAAIIRRIRFGADLPCLAAPVTGSSVAVNVMEALAIGLLMDGVAPDQGALSEGVLMELTRSGRSLMNEGEIVRDPEKARTMVSDMVREFLANRYSFLRGLGAIGP
ncbi:MAG: methyltransferase domain-containing protein [Acetobacteraceae bacterium]|nr:methyltransferase domain-containing protein [Acetobacteraceae bacterium]